MPFPIINCVYQDSGGYLWLGTEKGVSCFDGIRFKTFTRQDGLTDNKINVVFEDSRGDIWIGTSRGGINCLSAGNFHRPLNWKPVSESSIYSIAEDCTGIVWFGTSMGLVRFDGNSFRLFTVADGLLSNSVYDIAVDKSKTLRLGTMRGVSYYHTDTLKPCGSFTNEDGLLHNFISVLLVDSDGALWIGTQKGLNRLKDGKLTAYTTNEGLIHNSVNTIFEDADGNIWVGTWNGVSLFSGGNPVEHLKNISTKNGLINNFVYCISQDSEGNMWFGTHGGLCCLNSLNLETYTKEDGLSNDMITGITQDRTGRLWISTAEGLNCLERGRIKKYSSRDGMISSAVNRMLMDRAGKLWLATPKGLSIFSSGTFYNYTRTDGLPGNILFSLEESRDGIVWIGGAGGLVSVKKGEFCEPFMHFEKEGIFNILEDCRGAVWFSARNTLYRYSKNRIVSMTRQYGLPANDINTVYEEQNGRIWLGTENGVICLNHESFIHYTPVNSGLTDNSCYSFLEDQEGNLWIGTSKGLSCFDGNQFRNFSSQRMGLGGRSWMTGIVEIDGRLWFGTTAGLSSFFPPPVRENRIPPPIHITSVKVMEKEVPLVEKGYRKFDFHQNIFRFNFVGISYSTSGGVQYKYRMKNIDKSWQDTAERSLFYPFLPAGGYELEIKAVNSDGTESVIPARYRFVILPPYWKTWWFMVLVGLSICSLVVLAIYWKMRRDREKTELRARNRQLVTSQRMELMGTLAAGTVHDLKNLLAVIVGYSSEMSREYSARKSDTELVSTSPEHSQYVEIIKSTAATAIQMAKQILSFARSKNRGIEPVELGMVLTEILDTLKVTQSKNFRIQWEPPAEAILFAIHPARFQQLVMNLCLNAFDAMPEGGTVSINLASSRGDAENGREEILLEISDTGSTGIKKENLDKIFEPLFTTKKNSKGTGLGLFVVKQIVEEYNGNIEVRSEPGHGTTFFIRFSNIKPVA